MSSKLLFWLLTTVLLTTTPLTQAQQPKLYRVGVIHQGGPYTAVADGFRDGLRELGYPEGKQIVLEIRDTKSDQKLAAESAKTFERDKANAIFTVTTATTTAAKNATAQIPIVFAVGSDPVDSGLVQSFAKPGGRLTGVQYSTTDLTGKRLEILKEILPKLSRVITFYNPNNRSAVEAAGLARDTARQFHVQLIERHATTLEELRQRLGELKAKEVDAYFYISDSMVMSQAQLVIATLTSKGLPAMFPEQSLVAMGGLASYGQNFHEIGRLAAKYVQKLMTSAKPQGLRVERVDKYELAINLETAKQIGLTISPNVLVRADRVIK
jgi:putative ABC transport system substrate-binding protein